MKTSYSCLLVGLLVSSFSWAKQSPQSIQFRKGTWSQILLQAGQQHKLIFVDVQTSWCLPCKRMNREAFTQASITQRVNQACIAYQIDAEKGQGQLIAYRYKVTAYPTLLFINSTGTLLHRIVGYTSPAELGLQIDAALQEANNPVLLINQDRQYRQGRRDTPFLYAYLSERTRLGLPATEVLDTYLAKQTPAQLTTKPMIRFIADHVSSANSKAYRRLVQVVDEAQLHDGGTADTLVEKVIYQMWEALNEDFKQALALKQESLFDQYLEHYIQLYQLDPNTIKSEAVRTKQISFRQRLFYQRTKNIAKYQPLAEAFSRVLMALNRDTLCRSDRLLFEKFKQDISSLPDSVRSGVYARLAARKEHIDSDFAASDLDELARVYLQSRVDSLALVDALSWSKRAIELRPSPLLKSTYAQLLIKLGRRQEGLAELQKVLDQLPNDGLESDEQKELIRRIIQQNN